MLPASGEDKIMDFGLPFGTIGPGDCDAVRAKGLFRLCETVDVILGTCCGNDSGVYVFRKWYLGH